MGFIVVYKHISLTGEELCIVKLLIIFWICFKLRRRNLHTNIGAIMYLYSKQWYTKLLGVIIFRLERFGKNWTLLLHNILKKNTISLLIIIYSKLFACEVNTGSCIHLQPISLKQYVLPKISSIVVLDRTQMSNSLATCKGLFDLSSAARLSRRAGKGSW